MKILEAFIRLHTVVLCFAFLAFLAGIKWWNNGQSRTYNLLVIVGTILFTLAVALRVMAEFSN